MTVPYGYGEGPYGHGRYGGVGRFAGTYSRTTEEVYARLPDFYREADVDAVLKRWLSAIFDQVGEMRELRERLAIDPARVDPTAPTGEILTINAGAMGVTGSWIPVMTGTGVGQQTSSTGHLTWEPKLQGGTYELRLSYPAGPDRGVLRIEIDGVIDQDLDQYSPLSQIGTGVVVLPAVELDPGLHTINLVWTGFKRTESTGTTISVLNAELVNTVGGAIDNSDLMDPSTADDAWLDWLAQFVGVKLRAGLNPTERRAAVRQGARLLSGSRTTLVEAARTVLTGSRTVRVTPHSAVVGGLVVAGSPWDLTLVTNTAETPEGADVIKAVQMLGAKPAGVRLHHTLYTGTWTEFHENYPTWTAIHAKRTWRELGGAPSTSTPPPTPPPINPEGYTPTYTDVY